MGVVNVTPDSFSDGGAHLEPAAAVARARALIAEGADLVDLGAESTRPGAAPVPADEQWRRLEPVIEALARDADSCLAVDTSSAEVARRALVAGVHAVNDVTAASDPAMAGLAARTGAGLVLMHMQGTPRTMQDDPRYDDVARDVARWLEQRVAVVRRAGVDAEQIALDPGIGFGKTLVHNLELLARIDELSRLGRPIVVGASRKRFLGLLLDAPLDRRLEGGLAAAAVAVFLGAAVIRTHDVAATARALRVAKALRGARRVEAHAPRQR